MIHMNLSAVDINIQIVLTTKLSAKSLINDTICQRSGVQAPFVTFVFKMSYILDRQKAVKKVFIIDNFNQVK